MFIYTNISLSLTGSNEEGGREGRRGEAKIQQSAGSLKLDPECPEYLLLDLNFGSLDWRCDRASKELLDANTLDTNALDERIHCTVKIIQKLINVKKNIHIHISHKKKL